MPGAERDHLFGEHAILEYAAGEADMRDGMFGAHGPRLLDQRAGERGMERGGALGLREPSSREHRQQRLPVAEPQAVRAPAERQGNSLRLTVASASRLIAASPSKLVSMQTLVSAAAASNRRPTEDVVGQLMRRSQAWRNSDRSRPPASQSSPASQQSESALRQGSRAARSPPRRRNGRNEATRRHEPGRPSRASPPHKAPSSPRPVPSQVKASNSSSMPISAASAEACAE